MWIEANDPPSSFLPGDARPQPGPCDLLATLRQSLADGSQPPAVILQAVTEAARVLTSADGVAVALRTKGLILCRARSGELAPDVGSPLSADSGISGECLRSASLLLCHDTASDPRVDAEACRAMGVRSIVVVPLRGPTGIAGILEAFSANSGVFGEEQKGLLQELAAIAEAAYEREYRASQEAIFSPLRATYRAASFNRAAVTTAAGGASVTDASWKRRPWLIGGCVLAVLAFAGVWLSGREPAVETAASAPAASVPSAAAETRSGTPEEFSLPKPVAGLKPSPSEPARAAGVIKRAAQIEAADDSKENSQPAETITRSDPNATLSGPSRMSRATAQPDPEPPAVAINAADSEGRLASLVSIPAGLPTLDARVSQGVVGGALIHKVDPVYPVQARTLRVSGTVTMEIGIAENGAVREVKVVDGAPILAAAATDAVRRWRYSPSLLNGKPTAVQKQITVVFKLP